MPNAMLAAGTLSLDQDRAWPFYPLAFLHDAARFLALAHQGQLRLDARGRLQTGSVLRLAAEAILKPKAWDPRGEAQAPGLSLLVGLMGQSGYVAAVGEMLRLSPSAHDWLGSPAPVQLDRLRQTWWFAPTVNTRWLPPDRRQRPLGGHWRALILQVSGWAAALPADVWTPAANLYRYLSQQKIVEPVAAGCNLPRVRRAVRRQTLALADFLLQVTLPRLGLIEIGGKQDLLELRPAPGGLEWLQAALERADLLAHPPPGADVECAVPASLPRLPVAQIPVVIVEPPSAPLESAIAGEPDTGPDLSRERSPIEPDRSATHLSVQLDAPALCTFEIAHFAELLSPGPPARYQVTRDSLQQAVAWGYPVPDVIFLLGRFSADDLPPAALAQLEAWQDEMGAIACEPGYRLRTVSSAILDALRHREPFHRRTIPLSNGQDAWVSRAEARDLFAYLRRTGYILTLPPDPNDWPLQPRLHQPLPLSQLLVVLRTYRQLRRLVPGLAVLELGELEQSLASSLPSGDLAAVERLVASHVTFLRHHLRRAPQKNAEEQAGDEARPRSDDGAQMPASASSSPADLERCLQGAIEAGASLDITYADTKGHVTRRRVRPLHLETRWTRDYLLAFCELRQDERHFRLDRIVEVKGLA